MPFKIASPSLHPPHPACCFLMNVSKASKGLVFFPSTFEGPAFLKYFSHLIAFLFSFCSPCPAYYRIKKTTIYMGMLLYLMIQKLFFKWLPFCRQNVKLPSISLEWSCKCFKMSSYLMFKKWFQQLKQPTSELFLNANSGFLGCKCFLTCRFEHKEIVFSKWRPFKKFLDERVEDTFLYQKSHRIQVFLSSYFF